MQCAGFSLYILTVKTLCTFLHKPYSFSLPSSSSSVICQTTGPKPLPKRFLHIVRSRASSFNWQYPLLSLRSSSSFLRVLPRLLVTSICPFIFPSITHCRRQFLRKMWPIQLAFRFLISCRIFLCSLTLSNTSSFHTWSVNNISSKFTAPIRQEGSVKHIRNSLPFDCFFNRNWKLRFWGLAL